MGKRGERNVLGGPKTGRRGSAGVRAAVPSGSAGAADGGAPRARNCDYADFVRQRKDDAARDLRERRQRNQLRAQEMADLRVRRAYERELAEHERAIDDFWRRFFRKLPRQRDGIARHRARAGSSTQPRPQSQPRQPAIAGSRQLAAYSGPVIDAAGRRGVYMAVRYLGAKKASLGCARRLAYYIVALDHVEHDAQGHALIVSNMGERASEMASAFALMEDLNRAARANAKVVFHVIVQLPHDVTPAERLRILQTWCETEFGDRNLPYVAAVHTPSEEGDQRNFHAHVAFSFRPMVRVAPFTFEAGREVKAELDNPEAFRAMREDYATIMTAVCQIAGKNREYTGLSHAARGLKHKPLEKLGSRDTRLVRDGQHVPADARNRRTIARNEALGNADRLKRRQRRLERQLDGARNKVARTVSAPKRQRSLRVGVASARRVEAPTPSRRDHPGDDMRVSVPVAITSVALPRPAPSVPKEVAAVTPNLAARVISLAPAARVDHDIAATQLSAPVSIRSNTHRHGAARSAQLTSVAPTSSQGTMSTVARVRVPALPRALPGTVAPPSVRHIRSAALDTTARAGEECTPLPAMRPSPASMHAAPAREPQTLSLRPAMSADAIAARRAQRRKQDEEEQLRRAEGMRPEREREADVREAQARRAAALLREAEARRKANIAHKAALLREAEQRARQQEADEQVLLEQLRQIDPMVHQFERRGLSLSEEALAALGRDHNWEQSAPVQHVLAEMLTDQDRRLDLLDSGPDGAPAVTLTPDGVTVAPHVPADLRRMVEGWGNDPVFRSLVLQLWPAAERQPSQHDLAASPSIVPTDEANARAQAACLAAAPDATPTPSSPAPSSVPSGGASGAAYGGTFVKVPPARTAIPDGFGGLRDGPVPYFTGETVGPRAIAFDRTTKGPAKPLLHLLAFAGRNPDKLVFASDGRLMTLPGTPALIEPLMRMWRHDDAVQALVVETVAASRAAGRPVWPSHLASSIRDLDPAPAPDRAFPHDRSRGITR